MIEGETACFKSLDKCSEAIIFSLWHSEYISSGRCQNYFVAPQTKVSSECGDVSAVSIQFWLVVSSFQIQFGKLKVALFMYHMVGVMWCSLSMVALACRMSTQIITFSGSLGLGGAKMGETYSVGPEIFSMMSSTSSF